MSELKSLANSEQFPSGKRVAIMREMMVSDDDLNLGERKRFVYAWAESKFIGHVAVDGGGICAWVHAAEIPAKRMRPMTHAEVFAAIRDGAVVRFIDQRSEVTNAWGGFKRVRDYLICYSFTGSDTDVWQPMEVEE